jgi:hypothetical protein
VLRGNLIHFEGVFRHRGIAIWSYLFARIRHLLGDWLPRSIQLASDVPAVECCWLTRLIGRPFPLKPHTDFFPTSLSFKRHRHPASSRHCTTSIFTQFLTSNPSSLNFSCSDNQLKMTTFDERAPPVRRVYCHSRA